MVTKTKKVTKPAAQHGATPATAAGAKAAWDTLEAERRTIRAEIKRSGTRPGPVEARLVKITAEQDKLLKVLGR